MTDSNTLYYIDINNNVSLISNIKNNSNNDSNNDYSRIIIPL